MNTRLSIWLGLLVLVVASSALMPGLPGMGDPLPPRPKPPLDLKAPDAFETATFGLG